jgi:hypothetical protein
MNRTSVGMVVVFVVWGAVRCCGQEAKGGSVPPPLPALEDIHPLQEAIFPLLIPVVFNSVQELKTLLRDGEFQTIRKRWGDRYAVDVAFRWAEQLCWNNRAVSLLVAFLAMIDHRTVGIRVPLLGPVLWIPLTGEFPDEFAERLDALPTQVFPDSPPGRFGDRDKMQHFFGSAFLAYVFGGSGPAERVGSFIEWGEDAFVVDGAYDLRDLEANARGRRFAARLRGDRLALPSCEMQIPLDTAQQPIAVPE